MVQGEVGGWYEGDTGRILEQITAVDDERQARPHMHVMSHES